MDDFSSSDQILYTAQNHKYPLYIMAIFSIISIFAIVFMFFWFHMDYGISFFFLILMLYVANRRNFPYLINFFVNKIYLTSDGLLIKKNKECTRIKFEEIHFIKQENRGEETNFRTYLIIKLSNEEEIFCTNVANFKELVEKIKKVYPPFDYDDCFKEDVKEEIKVLKSSLQVLAILTVGFGIKLFGFSFYMNKYFWGICIIVLILMLFYIVPLIKKLNKVKSYSENQ